MSLGDLAPSRQSDYAFREAGDVNLGGDLGEIPQRFWHAGCRVRNCKPVQVISRRGEVGEADGAACAFQLVRQILQFDEVGGVDGVGHVLKGIW